VQPALITPLGPEPIGPRAALAQPAELAWCVGADVNGEHAVGLGSQAQYPTGRGSPRH